MLVVRKFCEPHQINLNQRNGRNSCHVGEKFCLFCREINILFRPATSINESVKEKKSLTVVGIEPGPLEC